MEGLGERKITFIKCSDALVFDEKLKETFPGLQTCGGYELCRSSSSDRLLLEVVLPPPGGHNSMAFSEGSPLGQAVCFIRPIQQNIDGIEITVGI